MNRRAIIQKGKGGRTLRVNLATKSKELIIDPSGFLTNSSSRGLSAEEQQAFSNWKAKVQSDDALIKAGKQTH